jgi:hypothetical protein
MSLTLAVAVRDRIEAEALRTGSALEAWAASHGATPTVELGYRRPTGAEGWPFVAVEPGRDLRDLRSGKGSSAQIAVACGYRMAQVERGQGDGLLAVDALAEAVLEALGLPWTATWTGREWDARTAERVAAQYQHPLYEVELAVTFGRVGIE